MRRKSRAQKNSMRVEQLEPREMLAGDTYLVNFQNDEATPPTRYLRDTGQLFGDRGDGFFYGWTADHTDQGRERSAVADQRLDTLVHFEAGQSWEFALANGDYEVTVAVGDPSFDDGVHTINVEGNNLFNAVPDGPGFFIDSIVVTVSDGRLTLDQGAAAEKATRINYVHIVGVAPPGNNAPATPTVTEPTVPGQIVNPTDVHMEAVGFSDLDGDLHKSTDWEIWAIGATNQIFSDPADGFVEFRSSAGVWPEVHPDTFGGDIANTGEWFGDDGITSTVLPFRLPDFGAVVDPFATADLGVHLAVKGFATVTNIDLYGVRVDASPDILASDFYRGASADPNATLIQEDFLTPASDASPDSQPNNFTDAAGDAALRDFLNDSYDGGTGAGQYVFLRLSYASDNFPVGWDGYQITTSESGGGEGDYPVLSYTTNTSELVWQTLGIVGVERLHTHLGDGFFQGGHAGRTELFADTDYELRVRFRDDAGAVSGYATQTFTTGAASTIFATELRDVSDSPAPQWVNQIPADVELPDGPAPASLTIEAGNGSDVLYEIKGDSGPGNLTADGVQLPDHTPIRVVIEAGSQALNIGQSDLTLTGDEQQRTFFLPAISLDAGQRLDLWVDSAGGTYFGAPGQTEPDFSLLARAASLSVPFISNVPGFIIEEVGTDYRLPVNIAFVENPGSEADDPLYFVTELYGSIQVVTRDGSKHEFATGLLDYNPTGPISGSGEQGLTGIAVQRDESDPDIYHLYVGMLWDNGAPPGGPVHYPKVERLTSVAGGLSMDSRTVLLNMQPEAQGQSHQISNITIGPDGKLYVHNGDGFDASTGLDMDQFRGKVLRMNLDGSAPTDNPFYNAADGITATDYIYAYGLRNPFGGAWRASDGTHYQVENGPSVDRFSKIEEGVSYGWDGSNASMFVNAIYNWTPATAPVNIAFVQPETFAGSQFPASMQDHAFVSESGPTYAAGPQANGKRITEFTLDANGDLVSGPDTLIEYAGTGRSSVVALAAGPDGLYFSSLYEDTGDAGPTASGARIYRVRYVNPLEGDYDIDGDVDQDDYTVWSNTFGSNLLLAADGNKNGVVDAADYTVWRDALEAFQASSSATASLLVVSTLGQAAEETTPEQDLTGAFALLSVGGEVTSTASGAVAEDLSTAQAPLDQDLLLLIGSGQALGSYGQGPASIQADSEGITEEDPIEEDLDEAFAKYVI